MYKPYPIPRPNLILLKSNYNDTWLKVPARNVLGLDNLDIISMPEGKEIYLEFNLNRRTKFYSKKLIKKYPKIKFEFLFV